MGYLEHRTHQNRHHSNHPTVSCRTTPSSVPCGCRWCECNWVAESGLSLYALCVWVDHHVPQYWCCRTSWALRETRGLGIDSVHCASLAREPWTGSDWTQYRMAALQGSIHAFNQDYL
jgi:hypothetical protein